MIIAIKLNIYNYNNLLIMLDMFLSRNFISPRTDLSHYKIYPYGRNISERKYKFKKIIGSVSCSRVPLAIIL